MNIGDLTRNTEIYRIHVWFLTNVSVFVLFRNKPGFGIVDMMLIFSLETRNSHHAQLKGTLSGVRQFLANESPLKMMKNGFYFTLKALFVLKIFKFLS